MQLTDLSLQAQTHSLKSKKQRPDSAPILQPRETKHTHKHANKCNEAHMRLLNFQTFVFFVQFGFQNKDHTIV